MIARLYLVLLRLLPADFHGDFAEEMCGVFEQAAADARRRSFAAYVQFCLREVWGLLGQAAGLYVPSKALIVGGGGVAGLLITAGLVYFVLDPPLYESVALLRPAPSRVSEETAPGAGSFSPSLYHSAVQRALSREVLVNLIHQFSLYPRERARRSMEELAEHLRSQAFAFSSASDGVFRASFRYGDRSTAQAVLQRTLANVVEEYSRARMQAASGAVSYYRSHLEWTASQVTNRSASNARAALDQQLARARNEAARQQLIASLVRLQVEQRRLGSQVEVVESASLPVAPGQPRIPLYGIGLASGLLAGFAITRLRAGWRLLPARKGL